MLQHVASCFLTCCVHAHIANDCCFIIFPPMFPPMSHAFAHTNSSRERTESYRKQLTTCSSNSSKLKTRSYRFRNGERRPHLVPPLAAGVDNKMSIPCRELSLILINQDSNDINNLMLWLTAQSDCV